MSALDDKNLIVKKAEQIIRRKLLQGHSMISFCTKHNDLSVYY